MNRLRLPSAPATNFADAELGDARKIADLDHRERFQVHGRAALLQAANHVQKIFKRQIGMQSTDHVKFRGPGANAFLGTLIDFIEREIVSAGRVRDRVQRRKVCNAPRKCSWD